VCVCVCVSVCACAGACVRVRVRVCVRARHRVTEEEVARQRVAHHAPVRRARVHADAHLSKYARRVRAYTGAAASVCTCACVNLHAHAHARTRMRARTRVRPNIHAHVQILVWCVRAGAGGGTGILCVRARTRTWKPGSRYSSRSLATTPMIATCVRGAAAHACGVRACRKACVSECVRACVRVCARGHACLHARVWLCVCAHRGLEDGRDSVCARLRRARDYLRAEASNRQSRMRESA
jgi:hypothetical protein